MKRRPCSGNPNRSSLNSPRPRIHSAVSDTNSLRSKSSQDLKRRRSYRGKLLRRAKEENESLKFNGLKKKDAFGPLESLFDVKRPLKIPEISEISYRSPTKEETSDSESDIDVKSPKGLIVNFNEKSNTVEQEPNILVQTWSPRDRERTFRISALEELERDIIDEDSDEISNADESSAVESISLEEMAEEGRKKSSVSEEPEARQSETPSVRQEESLPAAAPARNESKRGTLGKIKDAMFSGGKNKSGSLKSPEPAQSSGAAEEKSEGQRDSVMSSTPLTDSEVISEMAEAEKRCKIVSQEIKDTKNQISELKHKENLSEEDTRMIQEKQASLLKKMQEFDEITRKIQRVVGLSDPSTRTFAKMFQMLPYPHTETSIPEEHEAEIAKAEDAKKLSDPEERFELPEPEYPEDELPRAIICGFTEDRIPKIVIPDSRPKGTRCLKNLTGKLSESLNMQEKLVQENAKLEGGRYKLEEALLEKDNTLDSLQRKVCGLQAEMRIVVKENTELNRQLASLSNTQRSGGAAGCCFATPVNNSPRSTNRQQSSYSYGSSPRRDDESCCCRRCLEGQSELGTRQTSTVCVNPESLNPYQKSCPTSPRLSGGGSRDGYYPGPGATSDQNSTMCCRGPAGGKVPGTGGRSCPAEAGNQAANSGNTTKQLAQQLGSMEAEIRNMQMELANVHRERQQLEQQRKLLKCTGPCAPCSCCPPGSSQPSGPGHQPMMVPCLAGSSFPPNQQAITEPALNYPASMAGPKMAQHQDPTSCSGVCTTAPMGASTCPQQQLRDLREQYARLQEDYKNKLTEVSCMRTEMDKMKQEAREAKEERGRAESRLSEVQERIKMVQNDKSRFHGSKEHAVEQEQTLLVAKQRYREAQEELEELRSLIQDQANQLEDYRNKYLQAQELVEEQKRQLELMEMDNARMNENVNLEIGRVKNQFKEKLAELAPLPDILKQTQAKLQEVQQMRLIAERNCEDLSRELLTCKDKLNMLASQFTMMRSENSTLHDEKGLGSGRCDELEKKISDLTKENERMKDSIARFEEQESLWEQRVDEKTHEIVQLTAMLEEVREDSARQVARTKERCETVRRTMQGQISEMEKQLAQCRATARAAQKDRDEIRQKMQGQINNLIEAFEQAQGRIRSLQGHVNYLKTSYSNIFNPGGQGEPSMGYMPSESAGQGYDSCDCNY